MNYFVMDSTGAEHQLDVPDDFTNDEFRNLLPPRRDTNPFVRLPVGPGEVRDFHVDSIVWFGRRTQSEKFLIDWENKHG